MNWARGCVAWALKNVHCSANFLNAHFCIAFGSKGELYNRRNIHRYLISQKVTIIGFLEIQFHIYDELRKKKQTLKSFTLTQMTIVLIFQKTRFITTDKSFRISMLHVKRRHISNGHCTHSCILIIK